MHVSDYIAGFIRKGFLWGMKRNGYRSFIITDPFMKVIFYSYLAFMDSIPDFFPNAKHKPDIWMNMPQANLYGIQEFPLPHLLYRDLNIPPFTDEPLLLLIGDFNYASRSYARDVILRELENVRDLIRRDYLNVILVNIRHEEEVEETIGCILGGSVLRAMGFLVDVAGYAGHGLYLEKPFVKGHFIMKFPDIIAWRTEINNELVDKGIIHTGAFLPEITIYSLYGPAPRIEPDVKLPLISSDNIITIGEVEPSYRRAHSGYKQALEYDSLGQADLVFLIAPDVPRCNEISCLTLNPFSMRINIKKSTKVRPEKKNSLKYILETFTKSALLLNVAPEKILIEYRITSWHDLVTLPVTINTKDIIDKL
ncbi:hypothetical protein J4526_07610 [Desulfurococcaceae archaeon MEX13E-LK6-19]|nr:hypothetical protein J4526_07610 [Desulfurococcaceae archaeon MEX13E-LK6-19]